MTQSRPMQVSPPRVTVEVHEWLLQMSADSGLTISVLVGALLDRARREGWTVQPMTVTNGQQPRPADGA